MLVLVQGMVMGFVIAAPVGPIGLLCVKRTLEHGPGVGFATGLGAAVADTFYGAVVAFSLTTILAFINGFESVFRLFGGMFMLAVAWRAYRSGLGKAAEARDAATWITAFATGVMLTITNPVTVLAFVAILAGFGLGGRLVESDAATLTLGVFLGSSAWWFLLSTGIAIVRHRIDEPLLLRINRITAVCLAIFGIWAFGTGVRALLAVS